MPLPITQGAGSSRGYGFAGSQTTPSSAGLYIEEVFGVYNYQNTSATQVVANGVNLSANGGMVWIKGRNVASNHNLYDTARGGTAQLRTNTAEATNTVANSVTSWNTNGYTLGGAAGVNNGSYYFSNYCFRKANKFFDVKTVSHTNGTATNIDLSSLGTVGFAAIKNTTATADWHCWHVGAGNSVNMRFNSTTQAASVLLTVSGTTATISSAAPTATYVIYGWAHNAGGFGLTGAENVVSCGTFTATAGATINLGWEPQWLLIKDFTSGSTGNWFLVDNMRAFYTDTTNSIYFYANTTAGEAGATASAWLNPTGFQNRITGGATHCYVAIRRGPMRPPTTGTSVYTATTQTTAVGGNMTTGLSADMVMSANRTGSYNRVVFDRQRWFSRFIEPNTTSAEINTASLGGVGFDVSNVTYSSYWQDYVSITPSAVFWNFKRAAGFFDLVCYTGTGALRTVNHNLAAVPELMIVRRRDTLEDWNVYSAATGNAAYLRFNTTAAVGTAGADALWGSTTPTSSVFTVKTSGGTNASGGSFVAYLFATVAGVSKIGTYTGNGSSQTINCGFTAGSRFVMIKRYDSTGNWTIFDSVRGIVAGSDPAIYPNTSGAEVATADAVDTATSGFIVNQETTLNLNVSSATYLFLAIA